MKVKPIKKFSIDYRRYLGAVVLFVLLVLVLAKCSGPEERAKKEDNTEQDSTSEDSTQALPNLDGAIKKTDDKELIALIDNVYRAYVDNDIAVLEECYSLLSDNEKSYIETFAEYKEEYQNLDYYALEVGEGEYFVSPCYDLKFYGVETPAPGMDFFYAHRDEEGKLYVDSAYTTYNFNFMEQELDAGIYAKILAYNRREEITDLQQTIQASYEVAVASDESLANLIGGTLRNAMIQWQNKIQSGVDSTEPDTQDTQGTEDTEQPTENTEDTETPPDNSEPNSETPPEPPQPTTYQVRARVNCNIRAESSKNSERIGHAELGDLFTAIGEDGEWTIIEYRGGRGYIRSDLLRRVD